MIRFVLDCSVAMAWCFQDEADSYSRAVLASLSTDAAVVPALWPLEVVNVLAVAARRNRLSLAEASRFLELLCGLPLEVDGAPAVGEIGALFGLAREHKLSGYDAVYLQLAMRERLPLATRDTALSAAAKTAGVARFAVA